MIEIIGLILGIIGTISGLFALYLHYLNYKRTPKKEHSEKIKKRINSWLESIDVLYKDLTLEMEFPEIPTLEVLQNHLKSGYKEDWNLLNEIIEESLKLYDKHKDLFTEIEKYFRDQIIDKKIEVDFDFKNILYILFQFYRNIKRREYNITFEKEIKGDKYYLTIREFSGIPFTVSSNEEKYLQIAISIIKEIKNSERFKEIAQNLDTQMENTRKRLNEFRDNLWNKINLSGKILKGKCKLC